jgi:hypothetical protein
MKIVIAITALMLSTGCVTASKFDADRAYAKCDGMKVSTSRDKCMAAALQQADRERRAQSEDMRQREKEAEQRELDRVIAGQGNN